MESIGSRQRIRKEPTTDGSESIQRTDGLRKAAMEQKTAGMTKWKTVGLAAGEVYLAQIYEDPGVVFVSVSEQNTADAVPMEEDGHLPGGYFK